MYNRGRESFFVVQYLSIKKYYRKHESMKRKSFLFKILPTLLSISIFCPAVGCGHTTTTAQKAISDTEATSEESTSTESETELSEAGASSENSIATEYESESESSIATECESDSESTPETVTIMMTGDILLHTPIEEVSLCDDGTYDFTPIFENTKDIISSADLALVNQEVIIGGEELGISGYPNFNAPYEIADALCDAGFNVICHATNHALDKGFSGIENTLLNWRDKYPSVITLGIYDNEEDYNTVTITEINGIKIALLNYTYGTNGIELPSDKPYCVALLEEEKVISDLDYAQSAADFTIVCPHWGTEYELSHTSEQEYWRDIFISHGADLIIGTHPHVIEDIENIEKDGQTIPVYYSLGNFVNWTSGTGDGVANRMVGGIAKVEIQKDSAGLTTVNDNDIIPVVCHVESNPGGVTVYPLDSYTEELASKNEIIKQDPSFSLTYCQTLVDDIWGEGK